MSTATIIFAAAGSFGVGVGVGFFYTKKKLYSQIWNEAYKAAEEELMLTMGEGAVSVGEFPEKIDTTNLDREDYIQILEANGYVEGEEYEAPAQEPKSEIEDDDDIPSKPEVTHNVFEDVDEPLPDDAEYFYLPPSLLASRNEKIYIITKDEFFDETPRDILSQSTLTWYAADATLSDEDGNFIDGWKRVIGRESVKNFGVGTDEQHIVYVRNTKLRAEYEIILEESSYRDFLVQGMQTQTKVSSADSADSTSND